MSKKHEAAIERQQYTPKLIAGTCGNCAHVVDVTGQRLVYVDPSNYGKGTRMAAVVVGQKCGLGGFPVKKLGSCCEHAFAGEPESA
jgi:hypothetical protein